VKTTKYKPNSGEIQHGVLSWISIYPLAELDDFASSIASKYRNGEIQLSDAVKQMFEHQHKIEEWVIVNHQIEEVLGIMEEVE
jgi:hypothetical protein